jgi:hypothetical protein
MEAEMMKRLFLTVSLAGLLFTQAGATALIAPYLDDRSDGLSIIRSYYNALDRKEFARAWSYYGDDKPLPDYQSYENEVMTIDTVELVTGDVVTEGAAGSIFYNVPIAVRITREDGTDEIEAGCVVARIANPQIQGDPFTPLRISNMDLQAASTPLEDAVPSSCDGS